MKKSILISLLVIITINAFLGCSKKSNNQKPQSWLIGRWYVNAAYDDTVFNAKKLDSAYVGDVLTFTSDGKVASFNQGITYNYSLADLTIDETGRIYHIKQINANSLSLTCYSEPVIYATYYKVQ